eukprot:1182176-Prorocentrum_minimum.AAC.2
MEDMYGKADPKPLPPSYTPEDLKKMALAEEQSLLDDRQTCEGVCPRDCCGYIWDVNMDTHSLEAYLRFQLSFELSSCHSELSIVISFTVKNWREIDIPENFGLECPKYKWRQNQSYVEVYVQLPPGTRANAVFVELRTSSLSVTIEGQTYLKGDLYAPIKQDMSVWNKITLPSRAGGQCHHDGQLGFPGNPATIRFAPGPNPIEDYLVVLCQPSDCRSLKALIKPTIITLRCLTSDDSQCSKGTIICDAA